MISLARRYVVPAAPVLFILAAFGLLLLGGKGAASPDAGPQAALSPASPYDWLQFNGDPAHSGNNTLETSIGAGNVASLQFLFQANLPSSGDGAPVVLTGVSTVLGTKDLAFVTTTAGHIVALDAATGSQVWLRQYAAGNCKINNVGGPCYTTSSPAIDPNRLYVYSYGLDGYVHKYQVGDGTEIVTGGWPQLATLKGFHEKCASALAFATATGGATYLYVVNGGYPGDNGDYQGHVTAINLADGTQKVFNANCSDQTVHLVVGPSLPNCSERQTAVWARPGVIYDSVTDRIFMGTGNGLFDGNAGGHNWGDSVIAVTPDGVGSAGKPLDSYTPATYANLQATDADLGSTAPAILPSAAFAGRLAVQGGKDGLLRLIDLTNLSGQGPVGHVGDNLQNLPIPQGNVLLTQPAVWINPADSSTWAFIVNSSGSSAFKLTIPSGVPTLVKQWQKTTAGQSPLVANNVLYFASSGLIRAVSATTADPLWSDTTHVGNIHWQSPVVANGRVYILDQSAHLTAFALPVTPTPTATATATATRTPTPTPTPTPFPLCGPFTDVPPGIFCSYVTEVYDVGITTGTTTTTYSPAQNATRLQMVTFLSRTVDALAVRGGRRSAAGRFSELGTAASLGLTTVGAGPNLVRSDGNDLWVASGTTGSVWRVRASDGKLLDTWTGASSAYGVLVAMGRVFVTGAASPGVLYRIDPSQAAGAAAAVASNLGNGAGAIAFDGTRVWTANQGGSVSIVAPQASIPWTVTTVAAGFAVPAGALFDGFNVWVTDSAAGKVFKLDGGGAILQTVTAGAEPRLPVFDGENIW